MKKRKTQEPETIKMAPKQGFDTYKFVKSFMAAGLKEKEAGAIVEAIAESREYDFSKLATKDQLELVRQELKGEIGSLRQELNGEISALRQETRLSFANMTQTNEVRFLHIEKTMATKEDLAKLDASIKTWMVCIVLGLIGIIVTLIIKLN